MAEELDGVRQLFKKKLVTITRLTALERQVISNTGERGQLEASVAQAEGRIAEIQLQIIQMNEDVRAEAQKELRDVHDKLAELSERRVVAQDQFKRVEIRAPNSGYVHQLAAHTVGGVISPAEPVMLIVPTEEQLILEAKVAPQDRDQLHVGLTALVRLRTSKSRNTPELTGSLTRISPDIAKDSTNGSPCYLIRIAIPGHELARLAKIKLAAGMQAEAFIEVGARSPVEYLLKPLTDQIARAFRES
jgi:HlyD family secretion protein